MIPAVLGLSLLSIPVMTPAAAQVWVGVGYVASQYGGASAGAGAALGVFGVAHTTAWAAAGLANPIVGIVGL